MTLEEQLNEKLQSRYREHIKTVDEDNHEKIAGGN